MGEQRGGLCGIFEYAVDLFDASTIERFAGHFRQLLEGIVADPQARVGELAVLSESQREQLLVQWNRTARSYPQSQCIQDLFCEQASRTPESVALVYQGQQLSYRQLDERSNQLAHHLRALGVGPEVIVGLCVERSLEMVVGLLGILKAGGAYLPLDPSLPAERLGFMLEDANVPVLLTQAALTSHLPDHASHRVYLDEHWDQITQRAVTLPAPQNDAEHLAYAIYTSGSTGRPKAVADSSRGVGQLLTGHRSTTS